MSLSSPVANQPTGVLDPAKGAIWPLWAGALALLVLIGVIGMWQFGGYDHSLMIDVGWRLVRGQVPYRDFPLTLPVGFYLGVLAAFKLGGVRWASLVGAGALFAACAYVIQAWTLRRVGVAKPLWCLLPLAIEALSSVQVGYWWYNAIAAIAASLVVTAAVALVRAPSDRALLGVLALTTAVLALMKPNVAGAILALVYAVLVAGRSTRWTALGAGAIAGVADLALLAIAHVSPRDVLTSYLSVLSSRSAPSMDFFLAGQPVVGVALTLLSLTAVLAPIVTAPRGRVGLTTWSLAVGALLVGAYALFTNSETKFTDMPLVMLGAALPSLWEVRDSVWAKRALWAACGVAIVVGLGTGAIRYRVKCIGTGAFWEAHGLAVTHRPGHFFDGMLMGPALRRTLEATERVLAQPRPAGPVFFGPRIEYSYATFGVESPLGLPIWWHPGTSYALVDEPKIVQAFEDRHFALCIFLHRDFTRIPEPILAYLGHAYVREDNDALTIFRRK